MSNQGSTAFVGKGVTRYALGRELIVFSEPKQQLFRLNESAALIWKGCEERLPLDAIAHSLARTYHLALERARADVEGALAAWRAVGLLAAPMRASTRPDADPARAPFVSAPRGPERPPPDIPGIARDYRLLDTTVRIRFGCKKSERLARSALGHLEMGSTATVDVRLDVVPEGSGYRVIRDGFLVGRCSSASELIPLLHSHLIITTYRNAHYLVAIHAAAVSREERCILLPAPSGGGKSTLAAALTRAGGMAYLTDEVVLLMPERRRIRALPVSLTLKEPIWSRLAPLHPVLRTLPIHRRKDGKRVRYLPPPPGANARAGRDYRAAAIVFPRYGEHEPRNALVELSPAEAVQRIAEAGYDVAAGRLDAGVVGEVIDWIRNVECYELRYHAWSGAALCIRELLA